MKLVGYASRSMSVQGHCVHKCSCKRVTVHIVDCDKAIRTANALSACMTPDARQPSITPALCLMLTFQQASIKKGWQTCHDHLCWSVSVPRQLWNLPGIVGCPARRIKVDLQDKRICQSAQHGQKTFNSAVVIC